MNDQQPGLTPHELYQHELFYLTKGMKDLTGDLEAVCQSGAMANIPWEARTDLMRGIDAVSQDALCDLGPSDLDDLLQLRDMLASLPPEAWNTRIDTVAHCVRVLGTPQWSDVRAACVRLLPALTQACVRVGVAEPG